MPTVAVLVLQLSKRRSLGLGEQPGLDVVTVGVPPVQAWPRALIDLAPHRHRPALHCER